MICLSIWPWGGEVIDLERILEKEGVRVSYVWEARNWGVTKMIMPEEALPSSQHSYICLRDHVCTANILILTLTGCAVLWLVVFLDLETVGSNNVLGEASPNPLW